MNLCVDIHDFNRQIMIMFIYIYIYKFGFYQEGCRVDDLVSIRIYRMDDLASILCVICCVLVKESPSRGWGSFAPHRQVRLENRNNAADEISKNEHWKIYRDI